MTTNMCKLSLELLPAKVSQVETKCQTAIEMDKITLIEYLEINFYAAVGCVIIYIIHLNRI